MNSDRIKGRAKKVAGRIMEAWGALRGDRRLQAKGKAAQGVGTAQEGVGQAKDKVRDTVDRVRDGRS